MPSDRETEARHRFQEAFAAQMEGDYDRAVELYLGSLALHPTAEAYTFLGWTYHFQGKIEEAIAECKRAIEVDPDFGNPYNDIGSYMIELDRYDEAIPWLEQAMTAKRYEPRHFPYFNLGRVLYLAKGMINRARELFQKSLAIEPRYTLARQAIEKRPADGELAASLLYTTPRFAAMIQKGAKNMNLMLVALLFLQIVPSSPLLENDFIRVFKNSAPCATAAPSCGERVVVALGSVEVNGQKMERGDIKVFKTAERYSPPKSGEYLEVAIKPAHPKVTPPGPGTPPPPGNKVLYDGKDFTVFAEKMQPGEYAAPHSHNSRLAVFLNDTMVQQWTDGKEETRELVPDVVMWRPPVVHASKDVGKLPISNLLIEFKP